MSDLDARTAPDGRGPEDPGVNVNVVLLSVSVIFGILIVGVIAAWLLFPPVRDESEPPPSAFPTPTIEIHPVSEYVTDLARQRERLAGADGRLPIEAAMEAVVARGADAFAPVPGAVPPAAPPDVGPALEVAP